MHPVMISAGLSNWPSKPNVLILGARKGNSDARQLCAYRVAISLGKFKTLLSRIELDFVLAKLFFCRGNLGF
jgi:hypothetical protein